MKRAEVLDRMRASGQANDSQGFIRLLTENRSVGRVAGMAAWHEGQRIRRINDKMMARATPESIKE